MKKFCLIVFILGYFVFFHGILGARDANLTRVGEWGTGYYNDVFIKNNYAYCTASSQGLDIIDISNLSRPVKVGNCDDCGHALRLDVAGNYAYLATMDALVIVDISDPAQPVKVCRFDISGYVSDVRVKDGYAYLALGSYTENKALHIIDVSSPSSPLIVGEYSINPFTSARGLFISGSCVYLVVNRRLYIIDITTPSTPVLVGQVGLSGFSLDVSVSGNYAYVSSFWAEFGLEKGYLDIIDVSNPTSPVKVSTYVISHIPGQVYVSGNYAYFAGRKNGLHILDVSTPSTPSLVENLQTAGAEEGVVKEGENLFVAAKEGGLQILDVSINANPTLKGAYDFSVDIKDVVIKGNYAYAAGDKEGLLIFNIATPSAPMLVSAYKTGESVENVFISGSYVYMALNNEFSGVSLPAMLYIVDISNPLSPSRSGTYKASPYITDIYIGGNYAYVLAGSRKIEILTISESSPMAKAGTYTTSESNSGICVNGNYAYVTHPSGGVEVIDVSNPSAPVHAGSINSLKRPADIYINGNYAYVTGGELTVLDISTPASPSLVGTYDYGDLGSVSRLHVKGNYVYLPNSSGLRIVDAANPASPTLAADYDVPSSKGVYTDGNYVYLAGADYGKLMVLYLEENTTSPQIQLSPGQLQFAGDTSGTVTGSQTIYVSNSGGGTLDWDVSVSDNWIICPPVSGTNRGVVDVSVDARGLTPGTYTGSVFFSSPNAGNSPQKVRVSLTVHKNGQTSAPFGSFDTPGNGAVVYSSVPFTGWVLDDVGVQGVQLFREEYDSLVYIGDAVPVEGARPDVEQAYPGYPDNHKAGWGYMMLTNYLPNQGNGTFTIHAIAADVEGNRVTLGTKTIIADNVNAVKPFGAIDTPAQGGTASGGHYVNFGWVLTPLPNTIPKDGSTIRVWVDGVPIGHPVYNNYRGDVAAVFPDYNNSDGAVGYFYLDTTQYANGVHTIQWTAADDAGNTDGIGSRYFTIQNSGFRQQAQHSPDLANSRTDFAPVTVLKGFDENSQPAIISPGDDDVIIVEINELERIELGLSMNVTAAYQVVGQRYRALPWGSFLDRETGVFYWQPGHGFVGRYRLVFVKTDDLGNQTRKNVEVIIRPKY